MEITVEKKNVWQSQLLDRFYTLMQKHDFPESILDELTNFVLEVAREQYKVGNRSGIRWARMNPNPVAVQS